MTITRDLHTYPPNISTKGTRGHLIKTLRNTLLVVTLASLKNSLVDVIVVKDASIWSLISMGLMAFPYSRSQMTKLNCQRQGDHIYYKR